MRIAYCDSCGFKHSDGEKGRRVVRVTFAPMSRSVDLCGGCRAAFQIFFDVFLKNERPSASVEVFIEEAMWHLRSDPPLKIARTDLAYHFLQRALRQMERLASVEKAS